MLFRWVPLPCTELGWQWHLCRWHSVTWVSAPLNWPLAQVPLIILSSYRKGLSDFGTFLWKHLGKWPGVTCASATVHLHRCKPLALIQVISLTVISYLPLAHRRNKIRSSKQQSGHFDFTFSTNSESIQTISFSFKSFSSSFSWFFISSGAGSNIHKYDQLHLCGDDGPLAFDIISITSTMEIPM